MHICEAIVNVSFIQKIAINNRTIRVLSIEDVVSRKSFLILLVLDRFSKIKFDQ